jgi:hypothetical protein
MPDKRIKLAAVERDAEEHHKSEFKIAFTSENIAVLQFFFGLFFEKWVS